jgi:antitoxin MazE
MKTTTKIIIVGNSRGIRLPKKALEESGLTDEVELETGKNEIIIRSKRTIREGWEEAYVQMAKLEEDRLLLGEQPPSDWDKDEWQW